MNYADIKTVDIQDGDGVRVSIYVSGCHFHCKGCHNEVAWDFNYGKEFTDDTIDYILELMDHEYISGLSILGGEPLEIVNQKGLVKLVEKVKEKFPNKTIWCYTGYRFTEDVINDMYPKYDFTQKLLKNIDIIVDGEFIEEEKVVDLRFRGSMNQNKIDVKESLKLGKTVYMKFGDEERFAKKEDRPKVMSFIEFDDNKNESETKKYVTSDNIVLIENDDKEKQMEINPFEEEIAAKTNKINKNENI